MDYTAGYALFGALACTLALIPGFAYAAFRKPRDTIYNAPLEKLSSAYHVTLERMLDRPRLAGIVVTLAFASIGILGPKVGREYLPELDEGALWLQVQMPTGLSVDTAVEMANEVKTVQQGNLIAVVC